MDGNETNTNEVNTPSLIDELKMMPEYVAPEGEKETPASTEPEPQDTESPEADDANEENLEENGKDEEEGDNEDDLDAKKVTVKIGDQEQEVTVGELKSGYMRQADYTRKTQEVASIKDIYKNDVEELNQFVNTFKERFDKSVLMTEIDALEQSLSQADVRTMNDEQLQTYLSYKERLNILKQDREDKLKGFEEMQRLAAEENKKRMEKVETEEFQKLLTRKPEFKDATRLNAARKDVAEYLEVRYGKEDAKRMMSSLVDSRGFELLVDAAIGHKYQTNNPVKKANGKPGPRLHNDGIKTSKENDGNRKKQILHRIKSRGDRAPATEEEILNYLS